MLCLIGTILRSVELNSRHRESQLGEAMHVSMPPVDCASRNLRGTPPLAGTIGDRASGDGWNTKRKVQG